MELIDKSALAVELEKRIEEGEKVAKELPSSAIMSLLQAYKNILSLLDTLEVKEVEEPNNDLEEAARKVGQKYFPDENNIWARPNYEAIAAANAFKEGAKWQEEQIMKDAIEREVKEDAGGYPYIDATELYDYENDKPLTKAGDKINILIIKDK